MKRNEVLTDATLQLNLEKSTLSEGAGHKGPYNIPFHLYEIFQIGKSTETENRLVAAES